MPWVNLSVRTDVRKNLTLRPNLVEYIQVSSEVCCAPGVVAEPAVRPPFRSSGRATDLMGGATGARQQISYRGIK